MDKVKIDEKQVILLRDRGKTFEEIGKMFGISRQRAHQVYEGVKTRKNYLLKGLIKNYGNN